ncbi:hypothetical protein [Sphingomonas sp.]|uniref:hypothetical protein n=1 Tax=Sphingomonas sp. TaxID=28214 RepID=UPI0031DE3C03
MTFTLSADWWLAPAIVAVAAFAWAAWADRDNRPRGDYSFSGIASAFVYGIALIVSLIAWLIWAVLS